MAAGGGVLVHFDVQKKARFEVAYRHALAVGARSFDFEGQEYFVAYAKYLLQYLEAVLSGPPRE